MAEKTRTAPRPGRAVAVKRPFICPSDCMISVVTFFLFFCGDTSLTCVARDLRLFFTPNAKIRGKGRKLTASHHRPL